MKALLPVLATALLLPLTGTQQQQQLAPLPLGAPIAGGLRGTLELSGAGTTQWVAPTGVRTVLVELWGAGGGGSKAYSGNHAGDGGGGGAYVRTVVSVQPGRRYDVQVGAGGGGATAFDPYGTPGGDGGASLFLDAAGSVLTYAGGGAGGLGAAAGAGGMPDPAAMIGRPGGAGLAGLSTGGPGGASVSGSIAPPYPLIGGKGGYHASTSSGGDGADGYAILTW